MASSLISSSHHIDFDSVFGFDDEGLVQMFESLIATGLKNFLGCPAALYEAALIEFFENSSVRDGMVVSTIEGKAVEISEEVFAATFELPTEGLTDFSEVPKDLVFDARILFSISKEQVSISCLKKEMKIEYRLLSDILAKTIYVKAGSFDAVTRERFMLMTAITFDVKVNWSRLLFDVLKEMVTPGSRHAKGYAIQICVGGEEITDSPKLKKTPAKKAVSLKRPAVDTAVAPVVKKKRTTKGKPVAMETVAVAQEAVPLQIFEATADAPVEKSPVPKRKIQKRKRRLVLETDDEINVEKQPAVENMDEQVGGPADDSIDEGTVIGNIANVDDPKSSEKEPVDEPVAGQQEVVPVVEASTNDPDTIIEQVLNQLDSVATTDGEDQPAETAEERQWFDLPYEDIMAQLDAERPVVTASDTDEEMEQVDVFTKISTAERTVGTDADAESMDFGTGVGDQQVQNFVEDPADEEMSCDGEQAVDEHIDADKAMSLEDIILCIPVDVPLPSTGVEITKITMGKEIKIPGVDERTWHLASLPQIKVDDKGKEPLKQKDSIKGRPHLEHYSLICADIDLLVKLRAQVIDEVDQFFNSFSLKKLGTINVEDMTKKEEHVLYWGETESTLVALQRKGYILLKYREILVRKFLESWKKNFVPGDGSSATDLKVIAMLSDLHLFVLEEFKEQEIAHGLTWTKTCCSKIFEGHTRDRGAVIARNNTSTPSKCWIRTMIRVDGCSYVDTLPTVSEFFKIMTKRWADVCLEVVEFCVSGKLLPVGSINLCRSLPAAQPVFSVAPRQPTVLGLRISQFCTVFLDYSLFSSLPTADIRSFVGSIASERIVLRNVQIIQASGSVSPRVQLLDEHPLSASTSDDSAMNFDEIDTTATSTCLPAASIPKITEALAQLKFTARFDAQDRVLGELRKDSNDQRSLLSLDLKSSHKQLGTQISTTALDVVDVRRVVRENYQELNAKITSLDEQMAATRNDLLEFSAQAQQTLNIITDQLGELVAYINRGGNDKKGEVVSSIRPQPPPDDQNRDSGIAGGGGDTDRSVVERLLSADRQRKRERSRRHGDTDRSVVERLLSADRQRKRERSRRHSIGSYKRRRY
ncbi:hypothetical protein F511_05663 [Dorcoceras hygrometricum]|uniref:Dystroglycan-like n=1 Tax=Dorcoceras hygrometricum TaxID=472368 RepID=A0A2Z7C0Y1_9LAMI|nr:hypothetical protein F511_05663 [Dorcoceras hygrometricum]